MADSSGMYIFVGYLASPSIHTPRLFWPGEHYRNTVCHSSDHNLHASRLLEARCVPLICSHFPKSLCLLLQCCPDFPQPLTSLALNPCHLCSQFRPLLLQFYPRILEILSSFSSCQIFPPNSDPLRPQFYPRLLQILNFIILFLPTRLFPSNLDPRSSCTALRFSKSSLPGPL